MAASRTLEIIVKAKDEASKVLSDIEFRAEMIGIILKKTQAAASSALSAISNSLFSLKGALGGLGAGVIAHQFLEVGKETESLQLRMRILTGDVQKANELFEQATKYAQDTAFGYRNVMESVVQFRGVVKGGNEEAMKWTRMAGDLAAATGMNISQVTDQLTRMYQSGSASSRLFMTQGVLSMLGLQQGVELSAEQTRKKLMEMWESPTSAFRGAAADVAKTWDGIMSSFADKWLLLRDLIMNEGGVFNYLKAAMSSVLSRINSFASQNSVQEWARSVGESVISWIEKIIVGASWVVDAFSGWQIIWNTLQIAWYGLVDSVMSGMTSIVSGSKVVLDSFAKIIEADLKKSFLMADVFGLNPLRAAAEATLDTIKGWSAALADSRDGFEESALLARQSSISAKIRLQDLAAEVPLHEKVKTILREIRDLAASYNDVKARGTGIDIGEASLVKASTVIRGALERLKADISVESAMLKSQYAQRLIDVGEYYDRRREIIIKQSEAEIQAQRDLLKTQEVQRDPNKVIEINNKIYELEKKQISDVMAMEQERRDKQKKDAEDQLAAQQLLAEIRARATAPLITSSAGGLQATFDKELRDLEKRQHDEIELLKQKTKEASDIEDAYRNQRIEKDRLASDQQRRMHEFYIQQALDFTGNLESAFGDIYEATGKKVKAFFYMQKAASIATTIIKTYESAVKAFDALVDIPYVGPALGYAAAAAAIAAGMAKVAVISSTSIQEQGAAEGGKIKGYSPTTKSDNIIIRATAGEFMQPVEAVQHYGLDIMEGIRRKKIPKAVFKEPIQRKAEGGEIKDLHKPRQEGKFIQAAVLEMATATTSSGGKYIDVGTAKAIKISLASRMLLMDSTSSKDSKIYKPIDVARRYTTGILEYINSKLTKEIQEKSFKSDSTKSEETVKREERQGISSEISTSVYRAVTEAYEKVRIDVFKKIYEENKAYYFDSNKMEHGQKEDYTESYVKKIIAASVGLDSASVDKKSSLIKRVEEEISKSEMRSSEHYSEEHQSLLSKIAESYIAVPARLAQSFVFDVFGTIRNRLTTDNVIKSVQSNVIKSVQSAAEGGKIKGYSPTTKSDNIIIRATAGEFVQPVESVKHYGLDIMEGLRQRLIPKGILDGFRAPSISEAKYKTAFAAGGQVAESPSIPKLSRKRDQNKIEDRITINNLLDPALFAQYIASSPGEKQLLNFINNNSYQVRAMILR